MSRVCFHGEGGCLVLTQSTWWNGDEQVDMAFWQDICGWDESKWNSRWMKYWIGIGWVILVQLGGRVTRIWGWIEGAWSTHSVFLPRHQIAQLIKVLLIFLGGISSDWLSGCKYPLTDRKLSRAWQIWEKVAKKYVFLGQRWKMGKDDGSQAQPGQIWLYEVVQRQHTWQWWGACLSTEKDQLRGSQPYGCEPLRFVQQMTLQVNFHLAVVISLLSSQSALPLLAAQRFNSNGSGTQDKHFP